MISGLKKILLKVIPDTIANNVSSVSIRYFSWWSQDD